MKKLFKTSIKQSFSKKMQIKQLEISYKLVKFVKLQHIN